MHFHFVSRYVQRVVVVQPVSLDTQIRTILLDRIGVSCCYDYLIIQANILLNYSLRTYQDTK